jgi:hypothetical protein
MVYQGGCQAEPMDYSKARERLIVLHPGTEPTPRAINKYAKQHPEIPFVKEVLRDLRASTFVSPKTLDTLI